MTLLLLMSVAVLSWMLTGLVKRIAVAMNISDAPSARSSHTAVTPRGGGLGFAAAYCAGALLVSANLSPGEFPGNGILIAASCIAAIGFADDCVRISAGIRIVVHVIAAVLVLYFGGLPESLVSNFEILPSWLTAGIVAVAIVWFVNLYNFMDGIDGLAGIEAVSVCVSAALLYTVSGAAQHFVLPPLLLAASVLGFLTWNFPKARIFMGDVGSGFLGLMISAFCIYSAHVSLELVWAWMILLAVFITDSGVTLLRRMWRGEKIYVAHRTHAYQHAAQFYQSHAKVSLTVCVINFVWLLPLSLLVVTGKMPPVPAVLIAYAPLIWLAVRFGAGKSVMPF